MSHKEKASKPLNENLDKKGGNKPYPASPRPPSPPPAEPKPKKSK